MKRIFVAIVASLAIVLTVFLPAWAKSPTVKLRISGGSLASAMDVGSQAFSTSAMCGTASL